MPDAEMAETLYQAKRRSSIMILATVDRAQYRCRHRRTRALDPVPPLALIPKRWLETHLADRPYLYLKYQLEFPTMHDQQ